MLGDEALRAGLSEPQKRLPSELLYDDLGSLLFEAITQLPEYEVTRAELRLLGKHRSEIVRIGGEVDLIELGSGSGRKAKILAQALLQYQRRARFVAIDVSRQALDMTRETLRPLAGLDVETRQSDYIAGLQEATAKRTRNTKVLVLFLGSSLSNFTRDECVRFFRELRSALNVGDAFLLGTDLDKDPRRLLAAYDDSLGVTAAFNKNVLLRLNRECGANFRVEEFRHEARWNATERRIEMHLVALGPCSVSLQRLGISLEFQQGETLWTESSHRFSVPELRRFAELCGFQTRRQWIDELWPFAHTLFSAA